MDVSKSVINEDVDSSKSIDKNRNSAYWEYAEFYFTTDI